MTTPQPEAASALPAASPESALAMIAPAAAGARGHETYERILKSSVVIASASIAEIVIGMVRTKVNALLLGPSGFGLMGLYVAIVNLAQSVAGMGVNSSGVRQMAAAVGTGDTGVIARTAIALRRTSIALGLGGAVLLVALAKPVSAFTFGTDAYTGPVALLSAALLFYVVSDGQRALVQGLRRIADLAWITVVSGVIGTAASVVLVYLFRERGVAPSLVAIAAVTFGCSWWYSRRVRLDPVVLTAADVRREAEALLKLGVAFMASGMVSMGMAYLVRILVVRHAGVHDAGLYQSAWTIGGLYVGFILRAMTADFYPRLTAAIRDRLECNRVVNEQAEVSLLLGGPGIVGTLTFAPIAITVFYSREFHGAVEILRWICLGAALRIITWPIGFIIVAEGRRALFMGVELAYAAIYGVLALGLTAAYGAPGAGMAFFGSYIAHGLLVYPAARWITGFRWTESNLKLGLGFIGVVGVTFCAPYLMPGWAAALVGAVLLAASVVVSTRLLARRIPEERLPGPVRRLLAVAHLR